MAFFCLCSQENPPNIPLGCPHAQKNIFFIVNFYVTYSAAFPQYKIQLVQLEDDLLERLANAPDDILSDVPLIEGLEATKASETENEIPLG